MGKTAIEWTEHTWNPVVGCRVLTAGCKHCYAMKLAARLERMGSALYAGLTIQTKAGAVWTGEARAAPEHTLRAPLHRQKPTMYFVNSMSDLFYEEVPTPLVDQCYAVMALTPQHRYQVLTKRPERMFRYHTALHTAPNVAAWQARVCQAIDVMVPERTAASRAARDRVMAGPLRNVWHGTSVERQAEADERLSWLHDTPSAIRFISAEPLLGPLTLRDLPVGRSDPYFSLGHIRFDALHPNDRYRIDWVIAGAESGSDARWMPLDWPRALLAECRAARVPFFMKQLSGRGGRVITDMAAFPADLRVREFPIA